MDPIPAPPSLSVPLLRAGLSPRAGDRGLPVAFNTPTCPPGAAGGVGTPTEAGTTVKVSVVCWGVPWGSRDSSGPSHVHMLLLDSACGCFKVKGILFGANFHISSARWGLAELLFTLQKGQRAGVAGGLKAGL